MNQAAAPQVVGSAYTTGLNGATSSTFFNGAISNGGLNLAADTFPVLPSIVTFIFGGSTPNTYVTAVGGDVLVARASSPAPTTTATASPAASASHSEN